MASGPTHPVVKVGAEDKDNTLMKKAKHLVMLGWSGGVQEGFTV